MRRRRKLRRIEGVVRPVAVSLAVAAVAYAAPDAAVPARLADSRPPTAAAPADPDSRPREFTRVGDLVFFVATTDSHGRELFVTDGTPAGTRLVADLVPGGVGSSPRSLQEHDGALWFEAETAARGLAAWRTDGTEPGTVPVAALPEPDGPPWPVPGSNDIRDLRFLGDESPGLGVELFRSDGTPEGTFVIADLVPGEESSFPGQFTHVADSVFFTALTPERQLVLWETDGTVAGTRTLAFPASAQGSGAIRNLAGLDDRLLLFSASVGETGSELWRTDGTVEGTFLVADLAPGDYVGSDPHAIRDVGGGTAYFAATTPDVGLEPWRTDGTPGGTERVADLRSQRRHAEIDDVVALPGRVLFTNVSDGPVAARGIWESDGTAAGTRSLALEPTRTIPALVGFTLPMPRRLVRVGDRAFGLTGPGLLFVGGEDGPGSLVRMPLPDGAFLADVPPVPLGDRALLQVHAPAGGLYLAELWVTDGTPEGTVRVDGTGVRDGEHDDVALAGGAAYLAFGTSAIQRTDGTPEGTSWITMTDSAPWEMDSVTAVGDTALFVARNPSTGLRGIGVHTPGAPNASVLDTLDVRRFRDASGGPVRSLWGVGTTALFVRRGADEIWKTDGTLSHTAKVADVAPGWGGSDVLSDVAPVRVGNRVLFAALTPEHGLELWALADDALGAALVADVAPGAADSRPHALLPLGSSGHAVFAASDGVHGTEPWITDGTPEGTYLLADVRPGPESSNPHSFAQVGTTLFFAADGDAAGEEPWSLPLAGLGLPADAFDGSGGFDSPREPAGAAPEPLVLDRMRVRLDFRRSARDRVRIEGTVRVADGFDPAGAYVVAQVADLTQVFVLDADGRAKAGRNRLRLHLPDDGSSVARFTLKIAGALEHGFANDGLTAGGDRGPRDVTVRVGLLLDGLTRGEDVDLVWRVKRRRGRARRATE